MEWSGAEECCIVCLYCCIVEWIVVLSVCIVALSVCIVEWRSVVLSVVCWPRARLDKLNYVVDFILGT